jgi:virginiamycin B lyase
MRITAALLVAFTAFAAYVLYPGEARVQSAVALSGQVTSPEEGAMEGVVVSAKRDGSTMTISVVTDAQGRYAFPADRLEPGKYSLRLRATGFQLPGAPTAQVAAGQEAKADLKMTKLRSLSASLTNAEWLHSMPGTDPQKKFLLNCTGCHTLERIMKSSYDADGFMDVIARMSTYYPGTTPQRPQRLAGDFRRDRDRGGNVRQVAEWLASVNLSQQDTWQFPLKTLPRPTGKSTKVIFTEYDLPEAHIQPHEDRQGDAVSDPGDQSRLSAGLARPGDRPRRQYLARQHVPGHDRAL